MIARCARCQGTFTTDHFGLQRCPHCGSELLLSDPNEPPPQAPAPGAPGEAPRPPAPPPPAAEPPPAGAERPPAASGPVWGQPPPPPEGGGRGPELPPPAPPPGAGAPPPGGYGPPPGWGGPPGGGWGPPPRPPEPELSAPFAERKQRGLFSSYVETWKLVATQPAVFFRRVRIDQAGSAVLFAVISYTIGAAMQGLYSLLSGQRALNLILEYAEQMPEEQARLLRTYAEGLTGWAPVGQIVFAPLLALVSVYVGAGIVHLLLSLFRGANRPFDATVTTVAYAFGLMILLAVPGCGGLIAVVWYVVALIIGLGESQRCGTGKSAAAVLAPSVLVCFCCCGSAGLGLGGLLRALMGAKHGGGGHVEL